MMTHLHRNPSGALARYVWNPSLHKVPVMASIRESVQIRLNGGMQYMRSIRSWAPLWGT